MFSTQMRESLTNSVELEDIGEEAMEVLLSYIYTGILDLKGRSTQSLRELVDAADKVWHFCFHDQLVLVMPIAIQLNLLLQLYSTSYKT